MPQGKFEQFAVRAIALSGHMMSRLAGTYCEREITIHATLFIDNNVKTIVEIVKNVHYVINPGRQSATLANQSDIVIVAVNKIAIQQIKLLAVIVQVDGYGGHDCGLLGRIGL